MDKMVSGWLTMTEAERGAYDAACDLAELAAARARGEDVPSGADLAAACIERLCAAPLAKLLDAGVRPGDVSVECGGSLLNVALHVLQTPYPQSPAALPHALATLRVVLARAQPGDWLIRGAMQLLPLAAAASLSDHAVSQAVLDAIVASPGGFPAHAVDASPGILQHALLYSTPAFVQALLGAGAAATAPFRLPLTDSSLSMMAPLFVLALLQWSGDPRDFRDKLRLLLDAGADLEATDDSGCTALVAAALSERPAAFDALLAAGAQASALRVNFGPDAARFNSVLHLLAAKNDAVLIPRVLATGALDTEFRAGEADDYATPLQFAAKCDAPRAVSALLAGGASLTDTTVNGMNALQVAINRSCAQAARPLVEATPRAAHTWLAREAACVVAVRAREAAAARPGDTAAVTRFAAAREIAALLAA